MCGVCGKPGEAVPRTRHQDHTHTQDHTQDHTHTHTHTQDQDQDWFFWVSKKTGRFFWKPIGYHTCPAAEAACTSGRLHL